MNGLNFILMKCACALKIVLLYHEISFFFFFSFSFVFCFFNDERCNTAMDREMANMANMVAAFLFPHFSKRSFEGEKGEACRFNFLGRI